MLRQKITSCRNGQSIVEYTIVIGIVILVVTAMTPMIQRGIQGMIRTVADQVGNQQQSDQLAFDDTETLPQGFFDELGHLDESYVSTRSDVQKETDDVLGFTQYTYDDTTQIISNAVINLGVREGPPR